MLMSVFNPKLQKWEIVEDASEDVPRGTPPVRNDINSAPFTEQWCAGRAVATHSVPRGAPSNSFTTAFLEAAKVSLVHAQAIHFLQAGSSPYELIEWLVTEIQSRNKELYDMERKQSVKTNY